MELRDYIEMGLAKTDGSVTELAGLLELRRENLSHAKSGNRGLPDIASAKLAQLIGVPEIAVIAASEIVTAKDEKAREFWRPFAQKSEQSGRDFYDIVRTCDVFNCAKRRECRASIGACHYESDREW